MGTPNQGPAAHLAPPVPAEPNELFAGHDQSWLADLLSKGNTLVYIGVDDLLYLRTFSVGSGITVTIRGRVLRKDGQITAFEFRQLINAGAAPFEKTFQLAEGFLLDLVAISQSAPLTRGLVFAQLGLARGNVATDQAVAILISDYLTSGGYLSWPFTTPRAFADGQGNPAQLSVGSPGAGADFAFSVGANNRLRVKSIAFTLTTSAAVATREVSLRLDNGVTVAGQFPASITQAASLAIEYTGSAAPYAPATNAALANIPLPPDLLLPAGYNLRSSTTNLQAADQFSAIALIVEQWVDY